jgi:hypothetical protein
MRASTRIRTPLLATLGLATIALLGCSSASNEPNGMGGQTGATSSSSSSGSGGGSVNACAPSYGTDSIHLAASAMLAPGTDTNVCLRWTTPQALDISGYEGVLGPNGHHALLLARTGSTDPDGLAPCSESDIMDAQTKGGFQLLAGVSYETSGIPYTFPATPVQIGLHVDAGTQLIFDAHFLDTGAATTGCATLDLDRGKPVIVPLQFYTVLPKEEYGLTIPAHGSTDVTYAQPAGGSFRIAAASSHMHAGGTHFLMSIKETGQTLYETTNWAEPQPALFDTQKVVVQAGQNFQLDCSFTNDGASDQYFPQQMCVGAMYLLPCSFPGAC